MKKHLCMTCIAAFLLLTGCNSAAKTDGTYININGTYNFNDDFRNDPDTAISKVLAETDPEPSDTISLENGKFTITQNRTANITYTWSGVYSFENAALKFSYTDVNNTAEAGRITKLNETGAYPSAIMPRIYLADAAKTASRMPLALLRDSQAPAVTETHGDFLCTPLFGLTVDGSYQSGKDFALEYVPADTLRNDKYSLAYFNEAEQCYAAQYDEEKLGMQIKILANRYGIGSPEAMQFRVQCAGGKWEMTANNGQAVSKGAYAESKTHPGFIVMYEEPDDPASAGILQNLYPLFLYIDGNQIYYPGFVRKE